MLGNKNQIVGRVSTGRRAPGRSSVVVCVVSVAALILMAPDLYARLIFNQAQLARLHNQSPSALYERAVALAPADDHVRWQAGAGLANVGDADAAATILLPLAARQPTNPTVAELLLASLIDASR